LIPTPDRGHIDAEYSRLPALARLRRAARRSSSSGSLSGSGCGPLWRMRHCACALACRSRVRAQQRQLSDQVEFEREAGYLQWLVDLDDAACGVPGGVDGRDGRADGVPDDDGRAQPRLFDGAVYAVGDAFDVAGRSRRGCAVTGKVQRKDPPAGVNAAQLGERWPP
jgi:hypothetical protein